MLVSGRPVVVLAGWLGCHLKHLRRYEALYRKLGFHIVLSRIASPKMVVIAATTLTKTGTSCKRSVLPSARIQYPPTTMQELGWEVVEALKKSQCSDVIFHGFSNGGCFLWEQVRAILNTEHENNDDREMVGSLRSKLRGIVFDSSPAYFMPGEHDELDKALQYCTWYERLQVKLHQWSCPVQKEEAKARAIQFWKEMRNDTWDTRQLYLYSHDDLLTQSQPLEELIQHRRALCGNNRIFSRSWTSSPHCTHLRTHQNEYQEALDSFIHVCLQKTTQSKM